MRRIDLRSEIAKHIILILIFLTWISSTGISQSLCPKSILDERDGKKYKTVQIGDQCWMAQNLNIGTRIAGNIRQTENELIEKYCYNNDDANCDVYGGLYQWDEMMEYLPMPGIKGICPTGWHVPSKNEFVTLSNYLGGESVAGGKMKETGTTLWNSPNTAATNSSGFTSLPAGGYDSGSFDGQGARATFWSASQYSDGAPWCWSLGNNGGALGRYYGNQSYGFSVRCLKN